MTADPETLSWCMQYPEDALGLGGAVEDVRASAFLVAYVRIREFMWYQLQSGILDKTTFESYMAPTAAVFDSDLARRLWNSNVIRLDARFREQLDQLIVRPGRMGSEDIS